MLTGMRALLASFGTWGDIQPMVALARGLGARGHLATVAGPPDFADRVRDLGITYAAVGAPYGPLFRVLFDPRAKSSAREAFAATAHFYRSHYAPLASLVQAADVVVAASGTSAPLDLAERFGKRFHLVLFCPQGIPSGEHPSLMLSRWQWLPSCINLPSFGLLSWGYDLTLRSHIDDERSKLGLGKGPPLSERIYSNLVVASEPALAPLPRDIRTDRWVLQTGAFYLDSDEPLPDRVTQFLERGPAPVYVGFGSMADTSPERTSEWVSRAARQTGVRVILLGPTDAEDELVLTVTGVNHEALFPRCAAVIHHGGGGTTAVAARAGLPQVIGPHLMDQYYWADRLRRLGVLGPPLKAHQRSVPALVEAFLAVVADEKLRERARSLRGSIHGDGVARMAAALERQLS